MAPAETDDGEADDEPPKDPPARTGLDFLRALHADPPPVGTADPSACSNEKEPVHTPSASNAVAPDSAPATVSVTEVGESSSAASKKRRRYAQAVLLFGTPPAKPTPPPAPVQTPKRASRELTDAEKAEEKFLKAQQLYITQWLPRFDWLLLDKNEEGLPILRCSICVEHGKDDAKFGRDLQLGSMRCHEMSGRHDKAMKRQRTLMAEIEKQKRIDDFANTDKEGARLTRLMRGVEFICDHEAPIAMFPKLIGFLAEEGVEDIPLHEALVVKDVAKAFPDLNMIDAAVRAVGEIICRSNIWYERFKELQQEIHKTNPEHQGLFNVRWLSRGDAIARLCRVFGAAIVMILEYKHKIAATVQTFKFHSCLYFLADILAVHNSLNRFFQHRKASVFAYLFKFGIVKTFCV
ncbi:unnamed protein product [Closterium sp. Naga37s-1]|nr:unnamed protein product [Closterium sp. Naga37s-1]